MVTFAQGTTRKTLGLNGRERFRLTGLKDKLAPGAQLQLEIMRETGASETIPVQDGKMLLGKWQSIFLVELDHARRRLVLVQTMGVSAG